MTAPVAEKPPPPSNNAEPVERPRLAKLLRVLAIPIIILWVLVAAVTNIFLPSLDEITAENAGPLVARDAPSAQAAIHQGNDFNESNYTSVAVLLLETKGRKLGEQDHDKNSPILATSVTVSPPLPRTSCAGCESWTPHCCSCRDVRN